jgi:hypothetical protein
MPIPPIRGRHCSSFRAPMRRRSIAVLAANAFDRGSLSGFAAVHSSLGTPRPTTLRGISWSQSHQSAMAYAQASSRDADWHLMPPFRVLPQCHGAPPPPPPPHTRTTQPAVFGATLSLQVSPTGTTISLMLLLRVACHDVASAPA